MRIQFGVDDVIHVSKTKKVPVSELLEKKCVLEYIKKGYEFDDEVLKLAHITKTIRDVKIDNVFVDDKPTKKQKTLAKDTESLKNILKLINTLDKQQSEEYDESQNSSVQENDKNEFKDIDQE